MILSEASERGLGNWLSRRRSILDEDVTKTKTKMVMVFGGTGLVGGAVVRGLLSYPWFQVLVATRRPWAAEAQLLKSAGAKLVEVDLNYKYSLLVAMQGVTTVFLHTTFWEDYSCTLQIAQGTNAIEAAVEAGVEHLVFDGTSYEEPLNGHLCRFLHSRLELEKIIVNSGLRYTIVVLPFYYENFFKVFRPYEISPDFFGMIIPMESSLLACGCLQDMAICICKIIQQGDVYNGSKICLATEMLSVAQIISTFNNVLTGCTFIDAELTPEEYETFGFPGAIDLADMFFFLQTCDQIPNFSTTRALNPQLRTLNQWLVDNKEYIYTVLDEGNACEDNKTDQFLVAPHLKWTRVNPGATKPRQARSARRLSAGKQQTSDERQRTNDEEQMMGKEEQRTSDEELKTSEEEAPTTEEEAPTTTSEEDIQPKMQKSLLVRRSRVQRTYRMKEVSVAPEVSWTQERSELEDSEVRRAPDGSRPQSGLSAYTQGSTASILHRISPFTSSYASTGTDNISNNYSGDQNTDVNARRCQGYNYNVQPTNRCRGSSSPPAGGPLLEYDLQRALLRTPRAEGEVPGRPDLSAAHSTCTVTGRSTLEVEAISCSERAAEEKEEEEEEVDGGQGRQRRPTFKQRLHQFVGLLRPSRIERPAGCVIEVAPAERLALPPLQSAAVPPLEGKPDEGEGKVTKRRTTLRQLLRQATCIKTGKQGSSGEPFPGVKKMGVNEKGNTSSFAMTEANRGEGFVSSCRQSFATKQEFVSHGHEDGRQSIATKQEKLLTSKNLAQRSGIISPHCANLRRASEPDKTESHKKSLCGHASQADRCGAEFSAFSFGSAPVSSWNDRVMETSRDKQRAQAINVNPNSVKGSVDHTDKCPKIPFSHSSAWASRRPNQSRLIHVITMSKYQGKDLMIDSRAEETLKPPSGDRDLGTERKKVANTPTSHQRSPCFSKPVLNTDDFNKINISSPSHNHKLTYPLYAHKESKCSRANTYAQNRKCCSQNEGQKDQPASWTCSPASLDDIAAAQAIPESQIRHDKADSSDEMSGSGQSCSQTEQGGGDGGGAVLHLRCVNVPQPSSQAARRTVVDKINKKNVFARLKKHGISKSAVSQKMSSSELQENEVDYRLPLTFRVAGRQSKTKEGSGDRLSAASLSDEKKSASTSGAEQLLNKPCRADHTIECFPKDCADKGAGDHFRSTETSESIPPRRSTTSNTACAGDTLGSTARLDDPDERMRDKLSEFSTPPSLRPAVTYRKPTLVLVGQAKLASSASPRTQQRPNCGGGPSKPRNLYTDLGKPRAVPGMCVRNPGRGLQQEGAPHAAGSARPTQPPQIEEEEMLRLLERYGILLESDERDGCGFSSVTGPGKFEEQASGVDCNLQSSKTSSGVNFTASCNRESLNVSKTAIHSATGSSATDEELLSQTTTSGEACIAAAEDWRLRYIMKNPEFSGMEDLLMYFYQDQLLHDDFPAENACQHGLESEGRAEERSVVSTSPNQGLGRASFDFLQESQSDDRYMEDFLQTLTDDQLELLHDLSSEQLGELLEYNIDELIENIDLDELLKRHAHQRGCNADGAEFSQIKLVNILGQQFIEVSGLPDDEVEGKGAEVETGDSWEDADEGSWLNSSSSNVSKNPVHGRGCGIVVQNKGSVSYATETPPSLSSLSGTGQCDSALNYILRSSGDLESDDQENGQPPSQPATASSLSTASFASILFTDDSSADEGGSWTEQAGR